MKKKTKVLGTLLLASFIAGGTLVVNSEKVSAHGYVETPAARGYQGKLASSSLGWSKAFELYGNVITNPQSLEAPKGFPKSGPVDGRIASANGGSGQIGDFVLDEQTRDRWQKTDIATGENTFTWNYTASHKTTKWHYYMTKPGWDQNTPLTRDKLELIGTVDHDGSQATNNLSHTIAIPENRSGYNVILAVWDVADTANAFYSVIDVNVINSELPITPQKPTNLKTTHISQTSASLSWDSQVRAASFDVFRNGKQIATVTGNQYEDKALSANTAYTYELVASTSSGQKSSKSESIKVKTLAKDEQEIVTTPAGLHSMGETTDSISLMWRKSTHASGIKTYEIYRNGRLISKTSSTRYKDTGLKDNKKYTYSIKAVSKSGAKSDMGQDATFMTKAIVPSEETSADFRPFKLGSLFAPERYVANETVSHKGRTYKVLVTHNNYGDSSWNPTEAVTLFKAQK